MSDEKDPKYRSAAFKDVNLEAEMQSNGYVYLPGFLDANVVTELYNLYRLHHTNIQPGKGMWNSLYDTSGHTANDISACILELVMPALSKWFQQFKAPVASFMSKNPGEFGICDFHRDFSIADETAFEYRNVWIPLVDIERHNGALYALRGSHRKFNYPLPMFQEWPYISQHDELFRKAEVFSVKAGDLVVYADRTLHGSFLNKSQKSRPVVHLGLLHPETQIAYYHLDGNEVKVFDVPFEFYFMNNFGDLTGKYPLLYSFPYAPPSVSGFDL